MKAGFGIVIITALLGLCSAGQTTKPKAGGIECFVCDDAEDHSLDGKCLEDTEETPKWKKVRCPHAGCESTYETNVSTKAIRRGCADEIHLDQLDQQECVVAGGEFICICGVELCNFRKHPHDVGDLAHGGDRDQHQGSPTKPKTTTVVARKSDDGDIMMSHGQSQTAGTFMILASLAFVAFVLRV